MGNSLELIMMMDDNSLCVCALPSPIYTRLDTLSEGYIFPRNIPKLGCNQHAPRFDTPPCRVICNSSASHRPR